MKTGIFGGTFNPFHNGHLSLLCRMREALSLDRVIVIPTALPPHKDGSPVIEGYHRIEMCRLAVKDLENVFVSDMEIARGGQSYTVDTLRMLCTQYPNDELYLMVGGDSYLQLGTWYCSDEIYRLATVVGIARLGGEEEKLLELHEKLEGEGKHTVVVSCDEPVEISSTDYRDNNIGEVPAEVEDYIIQNGLYGREIRIPVDLDELTSYLRLNLSPKRFTHTLNVASEAIRLAKVYEENENLAYIAGLLHDICKEMPKDAQWELIKDEDIAKEPEFAMCPHAWHGAAAAKFSEREFSVKNAEILNAIRYHTTGRGEMSRLEEIIYMADLVCADRTYPGVEALRAKTYKSLEEALFEAFAFALYDLPREGSPIVSDTIKAYNRYAIWRKAQTAEA